MWVCKASSPGRRVEGQEGRDPRPGNRGRVCWQGEPRWSCCRWNFPSECRSCDRVTTFSGCLHSLERQRCGNVTVVGGKWGTAGMLPPMSSNITRRSSTVGHVRRHLGWGRIRSHGGCWYKTAHSWETIWCLRGVGEKKRWK